MTQTLTTERQQFEEYFNDFYGCHPTDHHDPIHVEVIWHAWQAINTRAANREAQPVGYIMPDDVEHLKSGDVVVVPNNSYCKFPLYTAQPAPAVPVETDLDSARMAVGFNRYIQAGYVDGWNACRAAMLDGPGILWSGFDPAKNFYDAIPDGWKLVPVELTAEMQAAWDGAPSSSDDDTVNMMNAYRAMLAAVPEGSN